MQERACGRPGEEVDFGKGDPGQERVRRVKWYADAFFPFRGPHRSPAMAQWKCADHIASKHHPGAERALSHCWPLRVSFPRRDHGIATKWMRQFHCRWR